MAYKFRTAGPWGAGSPGDLDPVDVDNNFWQAIQDIATKSAQGVGISNIVQSGNELTFVLTDHTLLGPYSLPVVLPKFKGEWQANYNYLAGDIISHGGSTYGINYNHLSDATFDPGKNDGHGNDAYTLLLANPALTIPAGGAPGQFLRKSGTVDFISQWLDTPLNDLSDVVISAPIELDVLTYSSGIWTNVAFHGLPSGGNDGDFVTQIGGVAAWSPLFLGSIDTLSDVATFSPINNGQVFAFNNGAWSNSQVLDLPMYDSAPLFGLFGSFSLDFRFPQNQAVKMNGTCFVTSFLWPTVDPAQLQGMRRIIVVTNSGSFSMNWPSSVKWPGGIKPIQTPNATDIYVFFTYDGGTTVFGNVVGQSYS